MCHVMAALEKGIVNFTWVTTACVSYRIIFLMSILRQRERAWAGEGQREREEERESQAGSAAVSAEPNQGLRVTWDHDLSWNQESDA